MRKIENLFIGVTALGVIGFTGAMIWRHQGGAGQGQAHEYPATKYGAFLAAQHAIYVNDFDTAAKYTAQLSDVDYAIVQNTRLISDFLSGRMPDQVEFLAKDKTAAARIIYDAHLVTNEKWDELYKRHKKDESALAAPLRIWAAVATGKKAEAIKFIDKLPTNSSWKSFIKGQIYAETGDTDAAAKSFADVRPEFMNINDYLYIMSFYRQNSMNAAADALHTEFTSRPGGMFMLDYNDVPAWDLYSGYRNALAFSLVQNVSHTQIMMYSDLSILLLRFAQITSPDFGQKSDAINYYLGQYFYNNNGDYAHYFDQLPPASPFYLFGVLRTAEKNGDMRRLTRELANTPLFVPAINTLVANNIKNGDRRAALRVINRAISHDGLDARGRAFFTKSRAHIHYMFGEIDAAQADLRDASDALVIDPEIMSLQAKIWAAENREIENAYDYAMTLVKRDPTDVMAWDTLGCVVAVREGVDAALDVLVRVGEVSGTCSSLYEHLGDLHMAAGNSAAARDAYIRAIDLADDGLVVVPLVEKKLGKIK